MVVTPKIAVVCRLRLTCIRGLCAITMPYVTRGHYVTLCFDERQQPFARSVFMLMCIACTTDAHPPGSLTAQDRTATCFFHRYSPQTLTARNEHFRETWL